MLQCCQPLYVSRSLHPSSENKLIQPSFAADGKVLTKVSEATTKDVDAAVIAAQKAFDTVWGVNAGGTKRASVMAKLADVMEAHADELASLEALDNGKTFSFARNVDIPASIACVRYYAGWADKVQGKTIEVCAYYIFYYI